MLKFIFVTFLIILFLRLVAPFLFRWLITFLFKKHIRKAGFNPNQNPFGGTQQHPFGNSQQHQYKKPSGNVRVDYIPEDYEKQKKDFDGGQYVDYEEIK